MTYTLLYYIEFTKKGYKKVKKDVLQKKASLFKLFLE